SSRAAPAPSSWMKRRLACTWSSKARSIGSIGPRTCSASPNTTTLPQATDGFTCNGVNQRSGNPGIWSSPNAAPTQHSYVHDPASELLGSGPTRKINVDMATADLAAGIGDRIDSGVRSGVGDLDLCAKRQNIGIGRHNPG